MRQDLAILRDSPSPAIDPETLALGALGWLLGDGARARRLLDLTGLSVDELRAGAGARPVLGAVLDFLCAHEPDLLAAADALGLAPQAIADAREALTR